MGDKEMNVKELKKLLYENQEERMTVINEFNSGIMYLKEFQSTLNELDDRDLELKTELSERRNARKQKISDQCIGENKFTDYESLDFLVRHQLLVIVKGIVASYNVTRFKEEIKLENACVMTDGREIKLDSAIIIYTHRVNSNFPNFPERIELDEIYESEGLVTKIALEEKWGVENVIGVVINAL